MNDMPNFPAAPQEDADAKEITLIGILITLAKHKRVVLGLPIATALVAAAISLVLPNVYKAHTKLVPPQQSQSGAAAVLAQLGGAMGAMAGAAGIKNPNDLYVGMLKSRTVADKLIARYDLQKAYDKDGLEKTRVLLAKNTAISASKDGLITIEVSDHDGKRAARVANSYVDELLALTKTLALTEASQRRLFFEQQLELSKKNLAAAEMAFKAALDTHGVISVDADSRAVLETVGRLRAQVAAKEIQLSSMAAFVTQSNPDYRRAREELTSLKAELSKLQNGRPSPGDNAGAASGGGLENIQTLREVKYHQMLYELLAKQYEVARLDEAKEAVVIQVLDAAIEPERHSSPKRALIVILSTAMALFLAIMWAFVRESSESKMSPQRAEQLATLRRYLGRKG